MLVGRECDAEVIKEQRMCEQPVGKESCTFVLS